MYSHGCRLGCAVIAIGLAGVSGVPRVVFAQRVVSTLDAEGMRLRYADTVDATATGFSPSLRIDWDRALIRASGTYAQFAHVWSADGSLDGSLFTPSVGPLSAELTGTFGGSTHKDGTRTGSAIGLGRLHLDQGVAGGWVGAGGGATSDGFASHRVREGEAGVWWGAGLAGLSLAVAPTAIDDSIRYTDVTAEGSWRGQTFELSAVAGTRAGSRIPLVSSGATTWGSVNAVAWLLPRVALLAGVGTYPVDYTQSFPGGRFASAGIRISLSPRRRRPAGRLNGDIGVMVDDAVDVRLTPAAGGGRILRVRAPNARVIEVNGDFTGWNARRMTRDANGWFELDTPLARGTYQMSVRVNGGAWAPPSSLATVQDEFGGVVGVLIVP